MAQKPLSEGTGALEIEEIDQANNLVATYIQKPSREKADHVEVIVPKNTNSYGKSILNAFLPAGYPHSVTSDYLEYQIYDSLQAFSSSIAGMLSSRAVLEGIGVGDASSSPTAALLLSVLQESMGRIATILFAHRIGTALEPECKMYRLLADVFNDAAMILDCLSPALPKASRVCLLSASSVLRSLCGVAAGSSKASLSAHFATQGNLGELNAKDSSQETIISLLGMLVGSVVVSHISSMWATWTALLFLLAVHLGMNYLAVRAVCMKTLNRQRANLALSRVVEGISQSKKLSNQDVSVVMSWTPTPDEVSFQESVFERDGVLRWKGNKLLGHCVLGVPLQAVFKSIAKMNLDSNKTTGELFNTFEAMDYILWLDEPRRTYLVVLKEGSGPFTQLTAWLHALLLATQGRSDKESVVDSIHRTLLDVVYFKVNVKDALEKQGWDLTIGAMETRSGTRIRTHKKTL